MSKDVRVYLDDILESIAQIEKYTNKTDEDKFSKNIQLQDAVMRRLEIIGEAVKNISPEFKNRHDKIPWKNIAGMRDILIHEYSGVKIKRIWKVIKKDMIDLKKNISEIRKELDEQQQ
ncbi:MAG: DUF86 domain-containing protein [Candidatus Aenigmarchaeota archaeon]|nr:DUF86 domain-containing protein [Candidatus Aenigmarchaeota archaeon]